MTPVVAGGSGGAARLLEDVAWQELVSWLEQQPAGETERLQNNRSMEGSRGLRRLTGQKAEPPWGLKFTLLGSGQEEMRAGLSWCGVLHERRGAVRNYLVAYIHMFSTSDKYQVGLNID